MSKRKQPAQKEKSIVDGLTHSIIKDIAASCSYGRGEEIRDEVVIKSRSAKCIEASISGKSYEIEINFETPVQSSFEIDADCTCPDDRDGACKHVCAVLLNFVDPNPSKKRKPTAKGAKNGKKKKYSVQELKESVQYLDNDDLIEIISDSLQFVGVQKIVAAKLQDAEQENVNISEYKSRIYQAVHQLDSLRPSQQFSLAYKIGSDLNEIIGEAEKLAKRGNECGALQVLVSMAEIISNEDSIEGEVWKSLHGCGGTDNDICTKLCGIVENSSTFKQNKGIYRSIARVNATLADYGIEDYEEVLSLFDVQNENDSE